MKSLFFLIFSLFISSCVVTDGVYYDPIYQDPIIVYDVWPTSTPFYNWNTPTYIYQKPHVYGPRRTLHNNSVRPRKPRKKQKSHKPRQNTVKRRR